MKICMYIQDISWEKTNEKVFHAHVRKAAKEKADLLVMPEGSYTPYTKMTGFFDISGDEGLDIMRGCGYTFSEKLGCPVVYGGIDMYGAVYSLYVNGANAKEDTFSRLYIKHTEAKYSPFFIKNYAKYQTTHLSPVKLKGKAMGLVAGEDIKHAAFARLFGQAGAEIIITNAKSGVDYNEWYLYSRARAVENNCFVFCATASEGKDGDAFSMGFTPQGRLMKFKSLIREGDAFPVAGNIRMYDTEDAAILDYTAEFAPEDTLKAGMFVKPSGLDELLGSAKALDKGLYVKEQEGRNIVLCVLDGADILLPEAVLRLLYNPQLSDIPDKKYIIINKWSEAPGAEMEEKLSAVLPVRAMENRAAVVMISPDKTAAFQRNAQGCPVVLSDSGEGFGIDLGEAGGPESIWVDIPDKMAAQWRAGYEKLIEVINGGELAHDHDSDQNEQDGSSVAGAIPECGFLDLL